jgi:hypothetical protein
MNKIIEEKCQPPEKIKWFNRSICIFYILHSYWIVYIAEQTWISLFLLIILTELEVKILVNNFNIALNVDE